MIGPAASRASPRTAGGPMTSERSFDDLSVRVLLSDALEERDRAAVFGLFDRSYRRANHAYLEQSLTRLRYLALATHGGTPAGFALAETRRLSLPRIGETVVALNGLCCIAPAFRRRGLMGHLEVLASSASGIVTAAGERKLSAGRMGHPVGVRLMARNPTMVPQPGKTPTAWQQEVGRTIAEAYGSRLDPETFVCTGDGTPVGYPELDVDATDAEWTRFAKVDRDRGQSLLTIAWGPDAPPGW